MTAEKERGGEERKKGRGEGRSRGMEDGDREEKETCLLVVDDLILHDGSIGPVRTLPGQRDAVLTLPLLQNHTHWRGGEVGRERERMGGKRGRLKEGEGERWGVEMCLIVMLWQHIKNRATKASNSVRTVG